MKGDDALEDALDAEVERAGRELRGLRRVRFDDEPHGQQRPGQVRRPRTPQDQAVEPEDSEPPPDPPTRQIDLHPELRREIYRLHRNLGHPDKQTFLRALKHANCRKEAMDWVRYAFKCPLCERRQKPKSQRPAHLGKCMPFNSVVGVDLLFYEDHILLNAICWGTDLQMVTEIEDKRAFTVCTAFVEQWIMHYRPPTLVVAD